MDQSKLIGRLSESELLQKAANASSEGITISIMSLPDCPLIFVNEGFQRLTGYNKDEVIGKNCRFLQGKDTDPLSVQQLREAIASGESCTVELLNYKKNGTPFWNRLSITPIRNHLNVVTHYVGIQSDITLLRETTANLESVNIDLEVFRKRILKELDQAKLVQQYLLPTQFPSPPKLYFASLFVPMDEIGGDFYDVIELSDDHYGLLIADVTGHGIPAALLTFMSSTTFKSASSIYMSTARTIALTNEKLFKKMPGDAFVTMFYAVYDPSQALLTYTQAGHPEAYIIRPSNSKIIPLNTSGTFIGAFSKEEVSFSEKEINLIPGDKLILYTDAITDTLEKHNNKSQKEFRDLLLENVDLPLDALFKYIYEYGLKCGNINSYPDDFTLLGMEVLG